MLRSLRVSAFAIVVVLAFAGAEFSQAVAEGFLVAEESQMHGLVNNTRSSGGLGQLPNNDGLKMMARRQAQNMAAAGFIFHTKDLAGQARSLSISYKSLGENVGVGPDVVPVQDAFMNSPGHRANIVDPEYNALGVGAVAGANGAMYFSQNFGNLRAAAPPPPPAQPAPQVTAPPPPPPTQAAAPRTQVQNTRQTAQPRPAAPSTPAPTVAPAPEPTPEPTPDPTPDLESRFAQALDSFPGEGDSAALANSRPDAVDSQDGEGRRQSLLRMLAGMLSRFFSNLAFWR